MNIKTKALKVEVAHVKPPKGFDYEKNAFVISTVILDVTVGQK